MGGIKGFTDTYTYILNQMTFVIQKHYTGDHAWYSYSLYNYFNIFLEADYGWPEELRMQQIPSTH